MNTIVKALTKFYQKLGGTPSDISVNATTSDVIDAITEVYTDKEGTHVEVSTELSEGTKIATITTNNTEHDIYAPAGGGDSSVVYVPITLTKTDPSQENPDHFTSELSASEIYDLIMEDHKTVILRETKEVEVQGLTNTYVTDFPLSNLHVTYSGGDPYDYMAFMNLYAPYDIVTTLCCFESYVHGEGYDVYTGYVLVQTVSI